MQGNAKVLEQLNLALKGEITAVLQYMVQAEMCENWGYPRLSALTKRRAVEEMHHAEALIERIIFLDETPNVTLSVAPNIGQDVQQQLEAGLVDETGAIKEYNEASAICREAGDTGTRELFDRLIPDEERHADFLESQLSAIKAMGIGNYLSQQVRKEE
jgi:bacterioferritin